MSWISATNAAVAIRQSNAIDRYATITIRKKISASTALCTIWAPQLGPTDCTLTESFVMPNFAAIAFWILYSALLPSTGVWTRQPEEPTCWTVIVVPLPAATTGFVTWVCETGWLGATC